MTQLLQEKFDADVEWRRWANKIFAPHLLSVIPPGAPLTPGSSVQSHMLGKIPGVLTAAGTWSGSPLKLDGTFRATTAHVKMWQGWGAGIGLQGHAFPGLDIDVNDAEAAEEVRKLAFRHLVATCVRSRPGSNRILLMYRCAPGTLKKRRLAWQDKLGGKHAVELLASRQYYNVAGLHPSGSLYAWGEKHPCDPGVADAIPMIDGAKLDRFFAELADLIETMGYGTIITNAKAGGSGARSGRKPIDDPSLRSPGGPQMVIDALKFYRNTSENVPTHNDFVRVLAAIKAALGPDREDYYGEVEEWALEYEGNTPEYVRGRWGSIHDSEVGADWLFREAQRYGFTDHIQLEFADPAYDPASFFELDANAIRERRGELAVLKAGWLDAYEAVRSELDRRGTISAVALDALISKDVAELTGDDGSNAAATNAIKAKRYECPDPATIAPRAWLYGRHLVRGYLSATIAPGGAGKSALLIAEILAMVTGRNLLDDKPVSPLHVWYWNGEDPPDELERRFAAGCLHYDITLEDIGGRLFINSGRETEIVIARDERGSLKINKPTIDALREEIRSNQIDVLVVDPLVASHAVPENDNGKINAVCRLWAMLADEMGCAIELVHHVRKAAFGQGEYSVDDARGAGALIAAVRSARTLNVMTKDEAAKAGVAEHRSFFRVDNGKANLAPPADKSIWRRHVSVQLGNGRDIPHAGDNVGVVTAWKWPDPSQDVTPEDVRAVQAAVAAGEWREDARSSNWVGHAIADALKLDPAEPSARAKIKALARSWIEAGVLTVVKRKDTSRRVRAFVEVGRKATA